jgi:hypothetical protein
MTNYSEVFIGTLRLTPSSDIKAMLKQDYIDMNEGAHQILNQ